MANPFRKFIPHKPAPKKQPKRKVTVATVNAALKKAGYPERIVQAKDYVYFTEGNAMSWYSAIVGGTPRVTCVQDVDWWVKQRNILAEEKERG